MTNSTDHNIKKGNLLFKCNLGYQGKPSLLNGMESYTICSEDTSIGSLCCVNPGRWSLRIDSASINLHGRYRYDLIEEAAILWARK